MCNLSIVIYNKKYIIILSNDREPIRRAKMKTVYMLTVIYTGGRTVDIEFNTREDRQLFFKCVNYDMCKFTFWEQDIEER